MIIKRIKKHLIVALFKDLADNLSMTAKQQHITIDGKGQNMKTTAMPSTEPLPIVDKPGYFNVTLIQDNGSPILYQDWNDCRVEVADRIAKEVLGGLDERDNWRRPILAAYVHVNQTKATHHYDLSECRSKQDVLDILIN